MAAVGCLIGSASEILSDVATKSQIECVSDLLAGVAPGF